MTNEQALENCRLFAARHRAEDWAKTILRFCNEGGATGSPLRAALASQAQPMQRHIYAGDCPDDNQPEARDPNCPACVASQAWQEPVARMLTVAETDSIAEEMEDWLRFDVVEAVIRKFCDVNAIPLAAPLAAGEPHTEGVNPSAQPKENDRA